MPRIPVGDAARSGIDWLNVNARWLFDLVTQVMGFLIRELTSVLTSAPELVLIIAFALLAWVVRSWRLALGTVVAFLLIDAMNQWTAAMQTMALVLIATFIAIVIAVPLGIWAAKSNTVSALLRPVLDFMQTMPAFVYLIPVVFFFSIGAVPGLVSTIVFALPPGVRMTELGIRGVDAETVEAGHSFGASSWQILRGIQLPLAVPTIMAGINQVIMLALSMAVIAGIVGTPGLGQQVVSSIATLNLGMGVEAGLSVVILAIYLDRLTAALGRPGDNPSSLRTLAARRRQARVRNDV
ncbi:MAG: proline/glycine betaine ABC transporter permease [Mobilicoccus sp.]|nr:proline/glycine betaine ABC transporter permease [Mobilicoccus sp.]